MGRMGEWNDRGRMGGVGGRGRGTGWDKTEQILTGLSVENSYVFLRSLHEKEYQLVFIGSLEYSRDLFNAFHGHPIC